MTRNHLFDSYEVILYYFVPCVNHKVVAFASHEVECLNLLWFYIADFSSNNQHVMIFNLQEKRTHIEAGIDDSETIC